MIKNVYLTSFQILIILKFSPHIFEKYPNIKFQENPPVGTELCHADGQTDMMKIILRKAPKNGDEENFDGHNYVSLTRMNQ